MNSRLSIVRVENILGEYLFQWFWLAMLDSYDSSFATLVCENYLEVAEWFKGWLNDSEWLPNKEIFNQHEVVYERGEEGLVFTDIIPGEGIPGAYIFIVCGDCYLDKDKTIRAVPEVVVVTNND